MKIEALANSQAAVQYCAKFLFRSVSVTQLDQLAREISSCQRCRLAETRTCAVPGEGRSNAPLVVIGEGPGRHEDEQGRPFVGASGKLLTRMLQRVGLTRQDVFITNVVKCRPPGNRDPLPDEIAACRPFLDRQLALIQPELVITLGRFSMARFWAGQSITRVHGQLMQVEGYTCAPMFHPAAALRNPQWMAAMQQDFAALAPLLADLYPERPVLAAVQASAAGAQQMTWLQDGRG